MAKVVLITGGSRGIGKAIAKKLESQGYEVFAPSSKELDIRSRESVETYIQKNLKGKKLYALISNAGIFGSGQKLRSRILN
mgnify:CR=1 FL=1